ncbi:MAG: type II/IV secretion system ATPase subunit [Methanolobus sp.]|uniref:type II/IV secretion system ATPase subunit n=1 Tax=Methanolobus sp. TaxID=1874737 RepID=UPI00272F6376|nr:type II/IV secretion system ATPase subunit [Methanolobus sp.]MDP2216916.1 type II/IV secretion system ATPase subunit [Methanolobus sp.]
MTKTKARPDIYLGEEQGLHDIRAINAEELHKEENIENSTLVEIHTYAPKSGFIRKVRATSTWCSLLIDNIISGISLLNKSSENEETLCPYKMRSSKKHGIITVNCKECSHGSTFQSPVCRKNVFNILLREPVIDRLVLSNLYERDYEGKTLAIIYMMAHLHDRLSSYSTARLTHEDCTYRECRKCASIRQQLIEDIIIKSGQDPLKACSMINRYCDPYSLGDMRAGEYEECEKCLQDFMSILQEMSTYSLDIKRSLHTKVTGPSDGVEDADYEVYLRSYVRPPFSTSRIYIEPPDNTVFLECYDIDHMNERSLPVSIYQLTDRPEKMYVINPAEYCLEADELEIIETVRKKMIRHRPKDLQFANPSSSRNYFKLLGKRLLLEEAELRRMALEPSKVKLYTDILAKYTTGLGILEDLLSDERITDVYVNAPADRNPVHVVLDGEECVTNIFLSQDDMDSMVSRLRSISGRPFGEATPVLEMFLKEYKVRVSVIGDPLSAKGIAYAFRKHAKDPWTLPKLINTGSISPLAAGLLSFIMDGQASVLVAGGVGAGKTSLLSAMLLEIPQKYRILTIEDTPEIPIEQLQEMGWKVQGLNSQSAIIKYGIEIEPSMALRASLRLGSSSLVMGEVRGPEVSVLYEAMQVGAAGNSVIGTIHGSSTRSVYERIVHTLGVPPASFKSTDAVIVCSNTRIEGSMVSKRRVIQIAEVNENWDPRDTDTVFSDVLKYNASIDTLVPADIMDRGQSVLISKIAGKWGMSIDQASQNIRLRAKIKEKMADYGKKDAFFVESVTVGTANNMFWLLTEEEKSSQGGSDPERIYRRWSEWFEDFASKHSPQFAQHTHEFPVTDENALITAGGFSEQ